MNESIDGWMVGWIDGQSKGGRERERQGCIEGGRKEGREGGIVG